MAVLVRRLSAISRANMNLLAYRVNEYSFREYSSFRPVFTWRDKDIGNTLPHACRKRYTSHQRSPASERTSGVWGVS
jgi:hypothetical protein